MNHPEIQRRAQAEIDSVVGYQRLPDFEDRASLPYMDAIMRETMRWHPVLPMGALIFRRRARFPGSVDVFQGLPHATSEDDVYQGYFIPKGKLSIRMVQVAPLDHFMCAQVSRSSPISGKSRITRSLRVCTTTALAGECLATRKSIPTPRRSCQNGS